MYLIPVLYLHSLFLHWIYRSDAYADSLDLLLVFISVVFDLMIVLHLCILISTAFITNYHTQSRDLITILNLHI